jgi:hypothetical protein
MNFMDDDGLTDADFEFLKNWEEMGKSNTADDEYKPEGEYEGHGDPITPGEGEGDSGKFIQAEQDQEVQAEVGDGEPNEATEDAPSMGLDNENEFPDAERSELSAPEQEEVDDGEGERGNSDEQRESDEPLEITPEEDDQMSEGLDVPAEEENFTNDMKENSEGDQEQKSGKSAPDDQEGAYDGIPSPGEACTNHCEDNDTEDHDGECPHCTSRIEKERELWGAIATDMNGLDIYPGDRLLVELPMTFAVENTILSANVPNQAVDPIRVAEATDGHVDTTICWLSGRISKFTGWHMKDAGNSIWTFTLGKQLKFVSLIPGQIGHDEHGSNSEEGDQLDIDDMLRDIEKSGQEKSEKEAEEAYDEDETDDTQEPEAEENEGESEEQKEDETDEDFEKRTTIPKHQKARFENLIERITKKLEGTFGGTLEGIHIGEIEDRGSFIRMIVQIVSRGMIFDMEITMSKFDAERDGWILPEPEANDEEEAA